MQVDTLSLFKALADQVRLRILRCVSVSELSVAELVSVLGLPQSTVSRHLKPLRDSGLVDARRDATSVFYRRGPTFADPDITHLLDTQLGQLPGAQEDRASVRRIIDLRKRNSREFFDRIAGSYSSLTDPGGGWRALAAGMAAGFTGKDIADLGSGEGQLTLLLARFARKVIAVDQSPRMLRLVEDAAESAGLASVVDVAEGDLGALPLADGSVDACFLSQALHHAAEPATAIAEAARVLRPGGILVVLDLVRHEQEWVKEQWADVWMGFEEEDVQNWIQHAGFRLLHSEQMTGASPDLPVLIAVCEKE